MVRRTAPVLVLPALIGAMVLVTGCGHGASASTSPTRQPASGRCAGASPHPTAALTYQLFANNPKPVTIRLGEAVAVSTQPIKGQPVGPPTSASPRVICRIGDSHTFYAAQTGSTYLYARVSTVGNVAGVLESLPITIIK